jgi:fatty acid synthase subunit alpha
MAPINFVAHELESHGVRTFSAKEMAFNILGLMHPLLFSIAWARPKRVETMRPASFDSYVVF